MFFWIDHRLAMIQKMIYKLTLALIELVAKFNAVVRRVDKTAKW